MKSIKWRRGQNGQLEFAAQTANSGRNEARDEQVGLAGLDRISAGANRSDSWVDATVTLLATIVFGLGWAVVEIEGADPVQAGYDQASQTVRAAWSSSAIDASMLTDATATTTTTTTTTTGSTRSVAVGIPVGEMWGVERERWTDVAPRSSKQ